MSPGTLHLRVLGDNFGVAGFPTVNAPAPASSTGAWAYPLQSDCQLGPRSPQPSFLSRSRQSLRLTSTAL